MKIHLPRDLGQRMSFIFFVLCLAAVAAFIIILTLAAPVLAATGDAGTLDPVPPRQLVLPTDQVWTLIAGGIVPLFTYAINKYAPWVSENVKALVLALAAAVAGGITQAITAGGVGLNQTTLQFVATAVFGAFLAHAHAWSRVPLSRRLGAGQNKTGQEPGPLQQVPV
jgi:hypothetical protein